MVKKRSKKEIVREQNMRYIIEVAEQVFAEKGYGGATTQEIADRAQLPKANVHYYFSTKKELYVAVLNDILDVWQHDADTFGKYDDPQTALSVYIRNKLQHSFNRPFASKVWASEIIQGAPIFDERLRKKLLVWYRLKTRQIQRWIDAGLISPLEPRDLLFTIWATTQHYADFNYQVKVLNRNKELSKQQREAVIENVTNIILRGTGISTAA